MHTAYWIGVLAGIGVALGMVGVAIVLRWPLAAVIGAVAAALIGFFVFAWPEAVAGAACGALGSAPLVGGALRRGGTRGGTAILLALVSLVGAALAFVPVLGYLEAAAVPLLGARLRRRSPDRHAGLRSLARD